jgi:hypothetical protein
VEHETKSEWFKRSRLLIRLLYLLGCLRLRKEGASNFKLRYSVYIRRLHPVSWILFILGFLIAGINKETIDSFKDDTVWW